MREAKWWARWWVRYFPGHAIRRLDGVCCMTCAAPLVRQPVPAAGDRHHERAAPPPVDLWDAVQRHLEQLPATDDEA